MIPETISCCEHDFAPVRRGVVSMDPAAFGWEDARRIRVPFSSSDAAERLSLRAGERVLLSGVIYTARDEAHRRMVYALERGDQLPFELAGQVIYYAGPCPARPGHVIGSLGPTTSGRMDPYTPRLLEAGLAGMIGKGERSQAVVDAMVRYGAVYFVAIGGAGALLSKTVKKASCIAYEDLGPEAVYQLEIEEFPVIVGIDAAGRQVQRQRSS